MEVPQKTKSRTTTWPSNPIPGHIPGENHNSKDTCIPMFIAVLFTIARMWKQPKCSTTEEWIKKMWYILGWSKNCFRFFHELLQKNLNYTTHRHIYMYVPIHTCIYIYIYIMEYYSATKRNEIVPFAEMWLDLEMSSRMK